MDMESLNIVFAMDHSGSMNRQDGQKTVPPDAEGTVLVKICTI